jgi:hypothetical protein
MEIKKILKIESPVHLVKLLENKTEIVDTARDQVFHILNYYIDCVNDYLYGCKCEEDLHYDRMVVEYENTIRQEEVLNHLMKGFGCDRIDFN